ncbi:MAG: adenosylcobinamide-GDP ribazoletransferase [Syntrophales bacterium]|nr:adenosylcobinamide-GDP ribazoletransferase [Syntrophales bacterium]
MKGLYAAIGFLTIFPVPRVFHGDVRLLSSAVPFFPLVGFLIGAVIAAADMLFGYLLPPWPVAVLTVLVWTVLTGGLHLDGLADTADGLGSVRERERMLAIMRDSRIGTMGVLALVFVLVAKMGAVAHLTGPERPAVLILAPLAGRGAISYMLTALPYARAEEGLAAPFIVHRSWWNPCFATLLLFLAASFLGGSKGLLAAAVAGVAAVVTTSYIGRRLGGFTGDTLGAAAEVTETILLTAALLPWRGL